MFLLDEKNQPIRKLLEALEDHKEIIIHSCPNQSFVFRYMNNSSLEAAFSIGFDHQMVSIGYYPDQNLLDAAVYPDPTGRHIALTNELQAKEQAKEQPTPETVTSPHEN